VCSTKVKSKASIRKNTGCRKMGGRRASYGKKRLWYEDALHVGYRSPANSTMPTVLDFTATVEVPIVTPPDDVPVNSPVAEVQYAG